MADENKTIQDQLDHLAEGLVSMNEKLDKVIEAAQSGEDEPYGIERLRKVERKQDRPEEAAK